MIYFVKFLKIFVEIKKYFVELKNTFILTDYLVGSPGWETHEAHPLLEVGLAVELQQRDVVVQRLAVVVVVDVGGGHPQSLSSR